MARPKKVCPHGSNGVRNCKQCKRDSAKKSYDKKTANNPKHAAEYTRKWRADNPEKAEAQRLRDYAKERERPDYHSRSRARARKHLGIPGGSESRQGDCPICGDFEMLVPDHNHDTGQMRDWICTSCNLFLGRLEKHERDGSLVRFLEYMKHWSNNNA